MKSLRLMLSGLPLVLSGCSTLSSVNWSASYPWNWFGSSLEVSEAGVGNLTTSTLMNEKAVSEGLNDRYTLRSGMKTENGAIVRYFEAMRDKEVKLVITSESDNLTRIDVMDGDIKTASGVKIGTPFRDLYDKAFGACEKSRRVEAADVICKAPNSQHILYVFEGRWHGPAELIPSDDVLTTWTLTRIIWHR